MPFYPIQPHTAVLRPIAEQTRLPEGKPWMFWFTASQ
jgi:hypothetical protein